MNPNPGGQLATVLDDTPRTQMQGGRKSLSFLDINTFFSRRAGGIRAFYEARIKHFSGQTDHRYVLVHPGSRFSWRDSDQNVSTAEIYGPVVSRDPSGYRFMLDYAGVYRVIRGSRPDVIEVGEPWLSGLFCLLIKKLGLYQGLLVSYFHSDPILTHLLPWANRGAFQGLRKAAVLRPLASLFYRVQRAYDLTVVSSRVMQRRLEDESVPVAVVPLGIPRIYLEVPLATRKAGANGSEIRCLFVGRLNIEKGIQLIRDIVPRLLALDYVRVTVIGRGGAQDFFAGLNHPRFDYRGFVEDPLDVRKIYDDHDILLAPGPFESFGLAVVEGMARGLVVVGPDTGGTGELLRDANSRFIFRANDSDDFLRTVMRAMECDWIEEAAAAREFALKQGTIDLAMKRIADLYVTRLSGNIASRSS
jgi:alpha-1,6-mannosyltransferase